MLKASDLRRGCIYKTVLNSDKDKFTIFKFENFFIQNNITDYKRTVGVALTTMNEDPYFDNGEGKCFDEDDRYTVEASDEERLWLNECVKQNKFITKEESLFFYIKDIDLNEINVLVSSFDNII